jgi:hypothetical protein
LQPQQQQQQQQQHGGGRRFTEEHELYESMQASRQAGPALKYDDRTRLALGVDPTVAGFMREASGAGGGGGGEHDRVPPPDWTRTHAGRGFPDMLDEPH